MMWEHDDREGPEQEQESSVGEARPESEARGEESRSDAGEPASDESGGSDDGGRSKGDARRDAWEKGLSEFQDVVGDILGSIRNIPAVGGRHPRHDLIRVPGEGYWAFLDLPGVEKADLEITTAGDDLTVAGERRRPELPEESEVLGSGRDYGRFEREMRIPADVDHTRIRARLESGVLKLVLPRRREAERTRVEIEE
jgi:HSP20 family molecular chaperone IbpA